MSGNARGLGSVVAVVILLAVTIIVAFAVSYWMGSVSGQYTRYEKLEISSAYATFSITGYEGVSPGWAVRINLKNSGSADTTIDSVLVNGKLVSEFPNSINITTPLPVFVPIGQDTFVSLQLKKDSGFTSGTTVEIKLHSTVGQDYPRSITLD